MMDKLIDTRVAILHKGAMDLPQFLAAVRRRLKEQDWSMNALARRSGLSSGTISKLLAGRRPHPSHKTMVQIAQALDLLPELVEPDYEPADVPDVARRAGPTPTDPGEVYLEGFREGFRQGIAWATRARPARQATGTLTEGVGLDQSPGTLGQTPLPVREAPVEGAPATTPQARRRR